MLIRLLCRPVWGVAWLGRRWLDHLDAKTRSERAFDQSVDEYLAAARFYEPLPKRGHDDS